MSSTLKAREHVERALILIEGAQRLLDEACSNIYPVVGAVDDWAYLCLTSEQIKAAWWKVAQLRYPERELKLDSE